MEKIENSFKQPTQEVEKLEKLTRDDVKNKLEKNENLEKFDLQNVHLVGLHLENISFRGSDVRGTVLYYPEEDEESEVKTNIKNTDWTDATFADTGMTYFDKVEAEGATFGYTENLSSRKKRHQEDYQKIGKGPNSKDTGGLYSFNGSGGNFKKTKWINADFGGGSGYEAIFPGADLSESVMEGCDLSGIDFLETKIDNIVIKGHIALHGMKINEKQIESIARAIEPSNPKTQSEFLKEIDKKGQKKTLEDYFGIIIVETKD